MNNLVFRLAGAYLNPMARVAPTKAASQALNLFCYPVRPRLKPRHKAFLDGAEKFQFSHGATKLQGYRWGRGKMKLLDRKSTRLNSSHVKISYAVFCLKKKKSDERSMTHSGHT